MDNTTISDLVIDSIIESCDTIYDLMVAILVLIIFLLICIIILIISKCKKYNRYTQKIPHTTIPKSSLMQYIIHNGTLSNESLQNSIDTYQEYNIENNENDDNYSNNTNVR